MSNFPRQVCAWSAALVLGIGLVAGTAARCVAADAVWPGKTWETRQPGEVGLDGPRLKGLAEFVGGDGCVVRHGYLAFTWGDAARRRDVASACKPWYTHFLFKAIGDGRLPSVDAAVVDFEPRLRDLNAALDHKDRRITWRHLANQTSCYGVAEDPGRAFDYSDYNMALLFDTLFLAVYKSTWAEVDSQVLRRQLTDVLECQDEPTFMAFSVDHHPGRLAASPRDFARFGLLYLRHGQWRDRQLLRREHVERIVASPLSNDIPRTRGRAAEMLADQRTIGGRNNQTDHNGSYSFAWWTNGVDRREERHWPDAPADTFAALGHGGKRGMAVFPSLDIILSWNESKLEDREAVNGAFRRLAAAVAGEHEAAGR